MSAAVAPIESPSMSTLLYCPVTSARRSHQYPKPSSPPVHMQRPSSPAYPPAMTATLLHLLQPDHCRPVNHDREPRHMKSFFRDSGSAGSLTAVPRAGGVHNIEDIKALMRRLLCGFPNARQQAAPVGHPRCAPKGHHQHPLPCARSGSVNNTSYHEYRQALQGFGWIA